MALESAIFYLPLHSHSLHRHGHAAGAAAATGEFVTFEGYDALLAAAEVKLIVDYIGCRDNVESGIIQGFQSALVTTIAQELARGEAEEIAAAVPFITGSKIIVAVTNEGKISVYEYEIFEDENGEYFEYGNTYTRISIDDFEAFDYFEV